MSKPDYVHVFRPEIRICENYIPIPNLYIKAETYDDDIDEDDAIKYLKKTYSMKYLKQIIIDKIVSGEIPLEITIADTDAYDISGFTEDEYITLEEFNKNK